MRLPGIATSPDPGTWPVYWVADTCRLATSGRLHVGHSVVRSDEVYYPVGRTTDGGVVLNAQRRALVLDPVTGGSQRIPHLVAAQASTTRNHLVAGTGGPFLAARVVDLETGETRWQERAWQLTHFSPSGRYILGVQRLGRQSDPDVGDVVGIFEAATGRLAMRVVLPQTSIGDDTAWESNDAVVVVGEDRAGEQAILRIAMDGSVSRATPLRLVGDLRLGATP